jgi:hypothetical protein
VAVLILALCVCGAVESAEFSELLDKVEAAYGGAKAVLRLETFRLEGETTSLATDVRGKMTRDYQAPDRMKVDIEYPDRTEVRLVIGDEVWRGARTGVRKAEGPAVAAAQYQLLRCNPPGVLRRYRDRLEDGGLHEHDNGSHRLLVLRWSDTVTMKYWVETATSRVTHVESVLRHGEGKMVFATEYLDFRESDGVLFPFQEKNYASGRHVANTRVERLILEPEITNRFEP